MNACINDRKQLEALNSQLESMCSKLENVVKHGKSDEIFHTLHNIGPEIRQFELIMKNFTKPSNERKVPGKLVVKTF